MKCFRGLTVARNFAANVGLPFQTPEAFFLGAQERPFARSFEPSTYVRPEPAPPAKLFERIHPLDLVIFVGSPGSGKSTFFKTQLEPLGYHRVNQDNLKSRERCIEVAKEYLEQGEAVAVDNTNRDQKIRKLWVDVAKSFNIPIRCVYFSADPALCQHNDVVRAMNAAHNPESRTMLPKIAFWGYKRDFQPPELEEGLEDITQVDFWFEGTDEERIVWTKYWT
jgi:bifunctional polynucleotide phosphatase/kinase